MKIIIPKNSIKITKVTVPFDELSLQAINFDNKKVITRFKNFKRCHYIFKCPEKHVRNMVNSIEQNLGIDIPVQLSLSSMRNAKEFFIRNLDAIHANKHIYQLTYRISCEHLQSSEYELDNNVSLTYRDIKSCFDTDWLNDGMLSFAVQLLNFHAFYKLENNQIPHVVFGDPLDINKLIIQKTNMPDVFEYVNLEKPVLNYEEDQYYCTKEMKIWYGYQSKGILRRILDYYESKKQIINKYATIMNTSGGHWIYIEVNLIPEEPNTEPYVKTIDNMNGSDSHAFHIRRSFAKYFGLFYKEWFKKLPLTDYDFDGHDLIDDKKCSDPFRRQKKDIFPSILRHYAETPTFMQRDGYNCGIISYVHCIETYKQSKKFHELDGLNQDKYMAELRTKLLSIASDFWLEMNLEHFNSLKEHCYMEHGEIDNIKDIEKWQLCHQLFDYGVFKYTPNDNENESNANKVFKKYKLNALKKMMPTFEFEKDDNENKDNEKITTKKRSKNSKKPKSNETKNKTSSNSDTNDDMNSDSSEDNIFLESKDLIMEKMKLIKHPNPRRHLYDVNDVVLYLDEQKNYVDEKGYTPSDMIARLLHFFAHTYCVEKSNIERKEFKKSIKKLMMTYQTYFIMDLVSDGKRKKKKAYGIIAALILEDTVYLKDIDHALIHMLSVRPEWENTNHLKILLYHVMQNTKIDNKRLYFVYQYGHYKFQYQYKKIEEEDDIPDPNYTIPETIFKNMKFKEYEYEVLDKLIEPQSKYLYGNAHSFYGAGHNLNTSSNSHRICYTHDYNNKMCKYSKEKEHYELYSHPFKWKDCTREHLQYIPPSMQKLCKENPNKGVKLKGGGHRDVGLSGNVIAINFKWKFRDEFQHNNPTFDNCCVWLAAVLLIDRVKPDAATYMLDIMKIKLSSFEWMFMTKIPKEYKGSTKHRLIDLLQRKQIGYTLMKVPRDSNNTSYLDHIMNPSTSGQYICQLESNGGNKNHVIGIDCNEKAIVDSCEKYALKLTRENLNHCCGVHLKGLKRIIYCYRLVKRS